MKKIYSIVFLCSINYYCLSQKNNVWCFGDSAGVSFSNITNPVTFTSNVKGRGSSVSIADSNSNLVFYSSTFNKPYVPYDCLQTVIWNSNNSVIPNGDTIVGDSWFHELAIIPFPDNNHKYYLFTENVLCQYGISYSIVDMNLNGGIGGVTVKNHQISAGTFVDASTTIRHGNGRDWWYIVHQWQTNAFYIYLITPLGVSAPSIQNVGSIHNHNSANFEFNAATNKLLVTEYWSLIEVFDFDRCTGTLSLYQTVSSENMALQKQYFGSSISPSGHYMYVSNTNNIFGDSLRLDQYDLTAPNIAASKINIYTDPVPASGGLHALGPDGKIYMACLYEEGFPYSDTTHNIYTDNLSVINYPDSPGVACNFQPFSFYLGGNRCYWGLPNNPDYELGRDSGSACDTLQWTGLMDHDPAKQLTINISPNPAHDKIFIAGLNVTRVTVTVYDVMGTKKSHVVYKTANSRVDLDVSSLSAGVYIAQIKQDNVVFNEKFVKK